MTDSYEEKQRKAEQASLELEIREGRAEAVERPLSHLSDQELETLSRWDPEQDPEVIEDLGDGVTLRRRKPRSTARRRLLAEPEEEPNNVDRILEEDRQAEPKQAAPNTRAKTPKRQTPPRRVSARIPLTSGLGQATMLAGLGLIRSGRDIPVGRALMFEAPLAGERLDQAIAGTFLDKLLQPIAKAAKTGKDYGGILALPIIVGIVERRPEAFPVLRPIMEPLVLDMALEMAEMAQRTQAANERAMKDVDPKVRAQAEAIFASFFEGMGGDAEPADAA